MKQGGQPQPIAQELCSVHAHMMLVHRFPCNVNDTRALIDSCSLVTSR